MDMLKKCSKIEEGKSSVACAILCLADNDLFRSYNKKSKILSLLSECAVSEESSKAVVSATSKAAQKCLFTHEANAKEIFAIFEKCIKAGCSKLNVEIAIGDMAGSGFFSKCNRDEISRVVDFLEKCLGESRDDKGVSYALTKLYGKNMYVGIRCFACLCTNFWWKSFLYS